MSKARIKASKRPELSKTEPPKDVKQNSRGEELNPAKFERAVPAPLGDLPAKGSTAGTAVSLL